MPSTPRRWRTATGSPGSPRRSILGQPLVRAGDREPHGGTAGGNPYHVMQLATCALADRGVVAAARIRAVRRTDHRRVLRASEVRTQLVVDRLQGRGDQRRPVMGRRVGYG